MIKETLFYNAGVILKDRIFSGGVLVEGTKIKAIYENKDIDLQRFGDCILIDLQQKYLSPGFIDIHVHGGGGYDFMDGTEEAFEQIAIAHARYGTTSLVPTTLT